MSDLEFMEDIDDLDEFEDAFKDAEPCEQCLFRTARGGCRGDSDCSSATGYHDFEQR